MLFIRMYFSVRALITPRLKAVTGRPLKNRYLGENNELLRLGKRIGSPRNDQNVLQNDYCSDLPTTTATARVRTALELRRLVSGGGSRRAQVRILQTIIYFVQVFITYCRVYCKYFIPVSQRLKSQNQNGGPVAPRYLLSKKEYNCETQFYFLSPTTVRL